MKPILITSGPCREWIDQVRYIGNRSTGALGSFLCKFFSEKGFEVVCFRGAGVTQAAWPKIKHYEAFESALNLENLFRKASKNLDPLAILHCAAVADYHVAGVENSQGEAVCGAKISSDHETLKLVLQRNPKLLHELPQWFPKSKIVGWKYEINGSQHDAIQAGLNQIHKAGSDACVVNGAAYGEGFGWIRKHVKSCEHLPNQSTLAEILLKFIQEEIS